MKKRYILIAVMLCLFFAGCYKEQNTDIMLTEDKDITLGRGDILTLRLETNPTTGYLWQMEYKYGEHILEMVREKKYERKSDLIGAGGIETYVFKCISKGSAEIIFTEKRPWEDQFMKQYKLKVIIN